MKLHINLDINTTQFLKYYTGTKTVVVTSQEGFAVQFPANILQKFVTHDGIHGKFILEYDSGFKFKEISKLS